MAFSLALMGLSFLLRPLMGALWHWYGLSVLQFVCFSGAALLPAGRLVGIWFPKTRGRVMGLTMMGNNFGGLVLPLIMSAVLAASSWQTGYLVLGIACVALAAVSFLVVRERPKTPVAVAAGAAVPNTSGSKHTAQPALTGWTVYEDLRVRAFYIITLVVLLGNFVYTVVVAQVYTHFRAEDVSKTQASIALSVVAAAGMAGKFSFGYLTERIPARFVMMLSFACQIVGLMLMLNPAHPAVMWTGVPLFGLGMGAFGALAPLLVQEGFGLKSFGTIMGLVNLATVVPFALGPLLAGLAYDTTQSYKIAFLVMAAMQVIGILLLTQAKVRQAR
jgi:MFS family permease